jgi:hypothetical protein
MVCGSSGAFADHTGAGMIPVHGKFTHLAHSVVSWKNGYMMNSVPPNKSPSRPPERLKVFRADITARIAQITKLAVGELGKFAPAARPPLPFQDDCPQAGWERGRPRQEFRLRTQTVCQVGQVCLLLSPRGSRRFVLNSGIKTYARRAVCDGRHSAF